MDSLTHGGVWHRTELLPLPHALSFLFCLRANPLFAEPRLVESDQATSPRRWYVRWSPTEAARERILANKQAIRLKMASEDGPAMIWVENDDRQSFDVVSTSGQVYTVEPLISRCDCPDYRFRLRRHGLDCKHLAAFKLGLGTVIAAGTEGHPRV
jgi:predicted nucleic acid-binding Zn finger protein